MCRICPLWQLCRSSACTAKLPPQSTPACLTVMLCLGSTPAPPDDSPEHNKEDLHSCNQTVVYNIVIIIADKHMLTVGDLIGALEAHHLLTSQPSRYSSCYPDVEMFSTNMYILQNLCLLSQLFFERGCQLQTWMGAIYL